METALRLHAAHSGASTAEAHGAGEGLRDAAASQLPLLLSAYGAES
jgi:hypothetical protein